MKRFKVQAQFYVQAADGEEAITIAKDMCSDMVSEQYEHVESVVLLGEVEQDEFHAKQEEV